MSPASPFVTGSPCDDCSSFRTITPRGGSQPPLDAPHGACLKTADSFDCDRVRDAEWVEAHARLVADAIAKARHVTRATREDVAQQAVEALENTCWRLHCRFDADAFIEACGLRSHP